MTTTLAAPRACRPTRNRLLWTLHIEGMLGRVRGVVEKQMLLLPEGEPGEVWFTRWQRRPDRTYSCQEQIRATEAEIEPFRRAIERLAAEENFVARLTQRSYHGAHVY
ncbi:hypothetical protein [Corynebacterium coyleae]|uniref:Uncharacterized protein n=2 Tax=Corynebacteriaceae TaxID=1653 RepID=A0AAP7CC06_9CORY|nr:hypothetical protein [Corynebacterium coyleae]NJJ03033.1 hypothetical protein [Corynebacterium coyleae]